jgi:hypothetical protein
VVTAISLRCSRMNLRHPNAVDATVTEDNQVIVSTVEVNTPLTCSRIGS